CARDEYSYSHFDYW
nr:immunoglobulin heavy chain junction region [Macaca mulatta]